MGPHLISMPSKHVGRTRKREKEKNNSGAHPARTASARLRSFSAFCTSSSAKRRVTACGGFPWARSESKKRSLTGLGRKSTKVAPGTGLPVTICDNSLGNSQHSSHSPHLHGLLRPDSAPKLNHFASLRRAWHGNGRRPVRPRADALSAMARS